MNDNLNSVLTVMRQCGRDISIYDELFLEKSVERRCQLLGTLGPAEYGRLLIEDRAEPEAFYDSLHITYSRFFREPFSFALIEQFLPAWIERRPAGSEIRVWSAGCAGGQEAYSIAMLLDAMTQSRGREMNYRIFATDISGEALREAAAGLYHADELQNLRMSQLQKYFIKNGDTYMVAPRLKKNVTFSKFDLLDDGPAHPPESIFGGFDIVFCRNVLMYYNLELRRFIMEKLASALSRAGYLVVGEAEKAIAEKTAGLYAMFPTAAVYLKKKNTFAHS